MRKADIGGSRKSLLEYLLNIGIDGESRRSRSASHPASRTVSLFLSLLPKPTPGNPLLTAHPDLSSSCPYSQNLPLATLFPPPTPPTLTF
jgi:hypothetical protein